MDQGMDYLEIARRFCIGAPGYWEPEMQNLAAAHEELASQYAAFIALSDANPESVDPAFARGHRENLEDERKKQVDFAVKARNAAAFLRSLQPS
jgi:hypothetical protein